MRAAKILAAVAMAILFSSTPGSSLNVPHPQICLPGAAISLLSASGTGIALISSVRCQ